jgi:uncharacterized membrane protein
MESGDTMPTAETLMLMLKKLDRGIDFYAVGNEPSWSLDIDFDTGMWFKSLTELSEMRTPPAREHKAEDADATRFSAQTEDGLLIAEFLRQRCRDTMSGEIFPFRVRVDVKPREAAGYTGFEGCGRYVVDYRLNDLWVVTRFGDRALERQDFAGGLPSLEFHLGSSRIVGSTGCNRISGRLQARGDTVTLGPLSTTRRACPNMAFEQQFLAAIADKTLRYRIHNGELVLTDDRGFMIEMAKTE